jgi:hemolysin activation/secretion protein
MFAWAVTFGFPANAQVPGGVAPPVDQLRRPGDEPLIVPEPTQPKAPPIVTPAPKLTPPAPVLSQGARVRARGFRFAGNTVVSEPELQSLAAPFIGRELGNAELEDLRVRITRRYIDAGYINSGATIPDQDISDGVIRYEIVEGRLTEILVGGNNRFRPGYLRDRLALGAEPVLNVNQLQERVQILLQDPQIERITAELAPGTQRGEASLRADVTGTPPVIAGVLFSNDRSPAVGGDQLQAFIGTRNLFGYGETFTLRPAMTEGLEEYFVGFTLPLNARGTVLQARYERTHSDVVEAPFDQLDISARSTSSDIGVSHPVIQHPNRSLIASALVAKRTTRNYFLGQPSPFIPGAPDGRLNISVLRFGADWVSRATESVFAARALLSIGIDAFGATVGQGFADSRFKALLTQAQWVRQVFSGAGVWVLRGEAQLVNDALPGPEKYSVGGMDSVRGYRKDQIVRDKGWFASAEYRHIIGRLALREGASANEGAIRAAVFVDLGQARDHEGPQPSPSFLASVGPGLRWEPASGLDLQLYWGLALRDVSTPTRTSQDRGIHFRATFTRAF